MAPKSLLFTTLLLFITISPPTPTSAAQFRCTSTGATCTGLVDYIPTNSTNISAVQALFSIKNLRSILGANNLTLSTPPNYPVPANQTIKIPFPCICNNGVGISNKLPRYTVVAGDDLYKISMGLFGGLVTVREIQVANNISDPSLILAGQNLTIPIPCSCDEVDGQRVVHYGYVVAPGSSVAGIAQQYNTSEQTLLTLNNMTDPKDLLAGAILDVPLRACSSMVTNTSLDYALLVPNTSYIFTANNCVTCKCDAAVRWTLQCQPSGLNSTCPPIRCGGSTDNLYLGNTTTSGCNSTTCAYGGYNNTTILTAVALESTCPAPNNRSWGTRLQGWRWNKVVIFMNIVMLCIRFVM